MEHRDQPWQVIGHQVGPDNAGLLAAMSELVERLVQRSRDVGGQRPGSTCRSQQVVFARTQRYRRIDQLGEAVQRVIGAAHGLDRRREVLGDALIQRGPDQLGLGWKSPVERSFSDACPTCDRSLGTVTLLEHPDIFERLGQTDDHAVIANTVEELMRYLSIVHGQVDRVATEDLTLGGQLIRAGGKLLMNLPAGNWDSEFVDSPDTFDVGRNTRGHLGFGYGVHQCIGANLARVEMQVAFATLARRLPGLQLAVSPDELKFKDADIYGMKELPVTW